MKTLFTKAIVKKPCKNIVHGLTNANLGIPDYNKALYQHKEYIKALNYCDLEVTILPEDERFPDSTFVEDTALLTSKVAIITNPGAKSRKGETKDIRNAIELHFKNIETIHDPGTIEAGDIMMVGSLFYIGLSERTNAQGARQMIEILSAYGMDGKTVTLKELLHLKSGLSYLEENKLLISGEFLKMEIFKKFVQIHLPEEETYASNSVWINDKVLIPKGFPVVLEKIREQGYEPIVLDVSEFQKLDGGLSCLSLRF